MTPSVHCLTDPAAVNMDPAYIPGAAMGYKMDDAGQITAGAVALNVQEGSAANIASIDRKILVSILVHEIGHVLGLGHSADKNAVMYYNAAEKKFASLAQDDVDGMTYLYARNELGEDPIFGGEIRKNKTFFLSVADISAHYLSYSLSFHTIIML